MKMPTIRLAVIALGGFVLSLETPEATKELFSAAMGGLNILLGGILAA